MDLLDMRAVFFNIAGVDILSPQPLKLRLIKVVLNSNHNVFFIVMDRSLSVETIGSIYDSPTAVPERLTISE